MPEAAALEGFFRTLERVREEVRGAGEVESAAGAEGRTGEASFWLQVLESTRALAELTWIHDPRGEGDRARDLRDEQMGKNLLWLAREAYPGRKIVVWAASYHIAASLQPIEREPGVLQYPGRVAMGEVVRKALGGQLYTLAFLSSDGRNGFFHGRKVNLLVPAHPDTLDGLFRRAGFERAFLDLRKLPAGGEWLREPIVARPLGYVPFRADWTRVFDGLFFIQYMTPATAAPEPPARRLAGPKGATP